MIDAHLKVQYGSGTLHLMRREAILRLSLWGNDEGNDVESRRLPELDLTQTPSVEGRKEMLRSDL